MAAIEDTALVLGERAHVRQVGAGSAGGRLVSKAVERTRECVDCSDAVRTI